MNKIDEYDFIKGERLSQSQQVAKNKMDINIIKEKIDIELTNAIKDINSKIDNLNKDINSKIDNLNQDINSKIANTDKDVETNTEWLNTLNDKVNKNTEDIKNIKPQKWNMFNLTDFNVEWFSQGLSITPHNFKLTDYKDYIIYINGEKIYINETFLNLKKYHKYYIPIQDKTKPDVLKSYNGNIEMYVENGDNYINISADTTEPFTPKNIYEIIIQGRF